MASEVFVAKEGSISTENAKRGITRLVNGARNSGRSFETVGNYAVQVSTSTDIDGWSNKTYTTRIYDRENLSKKEGVYETDYITESRLREYLEDYQKRK